MSTTSILAEQRCLACQALARGTSCSSCGLTLERGEGGVLVAPGETEVSYPETGADAMLAIEASSFWFRHRNDVISLLLERFATQGALWDVGGGNGFQALKVQESGRDVVLLEPGAAGARNAVARGVSKVVRGTIESLGLAGGSLGAISLFDVIEHLPDPQPVLSECRRVLRPDGRLFATVPAYQALWSDEDEYAEHHRRYDLTLAEEHLARAGFRIEFASYFFQALVVPIYLLRALPHRFGSGKRKSEQADLSEHEPGGPSQKVVEWLLARELRALRAGKTLAYGSSLALVAQPVP